MGASQSFTINRDHLILDTTIESLTQTRNPLLEARLKGGWPQRRQQSTNRVVRRNAVGEFEVLPQPLRVSPRPHTNRLGAIRTSEYPAHADHNQVSQQMLSIDRAEWIFQFVEILQNRNSIVVCHYLHQRALHNRSKVPF